MWVPKRIILFNVIKIKKQHFLKFSRPFTYSASPAAVATTTTTSSSDDDEDRRFDSYKAVDLLYSLRNEPNRALSFFRHLTNQGFQHDVSTYAAIIKILCIWNDNFALVSMFSDIIARNTVEIDDLWQAITEEQNYPTPSSIRVAHDALIKSYANVGMLVEAYNALFLTSRRGCVPDVWTCNYLMNRLICDGKVDMSLTLYRQLESWGFQPDMYTHSIVLKAYFKKGCVEDAINYFDELVTLPDAFCRSTVIEGLCTNQESGMGFQILQRWREENFPILIYAYTAVIRGFCHEKRFDMAEKVILYMEEQGIIPDEDCCSAFINGYCKVGTLEALIKVLDFQDNMLSKGLELNLKSFSCILQCMSRLGMYRDVVNKFNEFKSQGRVIDKVLYNIGIGALCNIGKVDEALVIFDDMKAKEIKLDVMHYTTLMNGYCLRGEVLKARELLEEMEKIGVEPDTVTYNILARGYSISGQTSDLHHILDCMEKRGLEPDEVHNTIIEGLCVGGRVKEAEKFLDDLKKKSLDNYAALINGYCEKNHLKDAYKLFDRLAEERKLVKKSSCHNLFKNLLRIGDNDKAKEMFKHILCLGTECPTMMYRELILAFCRDRDMNMARDCFDDLLLRGTPDVYIYTIMIDGYCKKNCFQEAYRLFEDMKTKNIYPDVVTYTVLLHGYPTDGNKEKIFEDDICKEMRELGVSTDLKYYTVLIDKHCRTHNVDKAIRLFNLMIESGLEADVVTYTILMFGCKIMGDEEKTKSFLDEMLSKGMGDACTSSILEHATNKRCQYRKQRRSLPAAG
ncbi:hypothetical protein ACFE04_022728 [Oxalis oulophora]